MGLEQIIAKSLILETRFLWSQKVLHNPVDFFQNIWKLKMFERCFFFQY